MRNLVCSKRDLSSVVILNDLLERLAVDVIGRIFGGDRPAGRAHDRGRLKQHTYPSPEEFRAFHSKELSLIDLREYVDILQGFWFFDRVPSVGERRTTVPLRRLGRR